MVRVIILENPKMLFFLRCVFFSSQRPIRHFHQRSQPNQNTRKNTRQNTTLVQIVGRSIYIDNVSIPFTRRAQSVIVK